MCGILSSTGSEYSSRLRLPSSPLSEEPEEATVDAVAAGAGIDHQWYRKPSEVPWADIMIVGSGITDYIDSELFESVINQYV